MEKYIWKTKQIVLVSMVFVLLYVMCNYNVLYDITIILNLICTSYALGCWFNIQGESFEKVVMRTAIGLGIIGESIYFILLLGLGNKSVYVMLLCVFFVFSIKTLAKKRDELLETVYMFRDFSEKHMFLTVFLLILFGVYIVCGSTPINTYDTLTKHLPITLYAVENGQWYTNVTESIVYGEPMVLQYTYATLFASLGAYKALILFNVILMFGVFTVLCYIVRSIYKQTSLMLLALILLTTPFFFQFSTMFYLEILPLFFLFAAFVGMGKIEMEKTWYNIEFISLLCGFSLFVKLTHVFTLAVIALVAISVCVKYAIQNKKINLAIRKAIKSVILVILPFVTSLIHIWYKTGNPLFPNYNGIFQSPYFAIQNFADPFTNKLTFSVKSLMDIVFHTTSNIEMAPLGMGIFLLFVYVLPIAAIVLVIRNGKRGSINYLIWMVIALFAYITNTITTYNLRYYFAVWVLMACVIAIGISVCISLIPINVVRNIMLFIIGGIVLVPNLYYIDTYNNLGAKIVKDERLVNNEYCTIFDAIPEGKRVLSITNSNQFKGQYNGYFASTTWHNSTLDKVNAGQYEWRDYFSSFDYIVIDKLIDEVFSVSEEIIDTVKPFLGEVCAENSVCVLYEVIPQRKHILHAEFETPQVTSVVEPIFEMIPNDMREYYIKHVVINETNESINMRYQINWMSEEGELVDVYIATYDALPGEHEYLSWAIPANEEAKYGIVYVTTSSEEKVLIKEYSVEGVIDIIGSETKILENRELLREYIK